MSLRGLPNILKALAIGLLAIAVVGAGWVLYYRFSASPTVETYRDCVKAGNPVQTSYPAVCITEDGQRFTDPANKVFQPPYEGGVPATQ